MFPETLNFNQQSHKGKKLSSFLKILTLKDLSWIRELEEILKVIIMDIVALNFLVLHMKGRAGKEQWQANWCPGWEPGIRSQEVRHEQSMSDLGQVPKPRCLVSLFWKGKRRGWTIQSFSSLETLNFTR